MARYLALMKNTWWMWLLLLGGGGLLSYFDKVFLVTFPICIFTFFWFAYIRYDDDGNFKGS